MNEGVYFLLAGVTASLGITCQHFRHEVGQHCVTLLTCPMDQGLISEGEHLTKRCTAIGCLGVGVGSGDHQ